MKRSIAVVATTAAAALAAPAAQAATLAVDPVEPCYRETQTVLLPGSGFTPNARVDFSKNGAILPVDPPILADPAGLVQATLTLPGLLKGQERLSYMATDSANPANTGEVSLLVTATDIVLSPEDGKPGRLLTIRGRGFFGGGKRLWAHVVRTGGSGKARNVKVGKIKGACKKVKARKRIFSGGARARRLHGPVRRLQALQEGPLGQVDLQRHDLPYGPSRGVRGGRELAPTRLAASRATRRSARTARRARARPARGGPSA